MHHGSIDVNSGNLLFLFCSYAPRNPSRFASVPWDRRQSARAGSVPARCRRGLTGFGPGMAGCPPGFGETGRGRRSSRQGWPEGCGTGAASGQDRRTTRLDLPDFGRPRRHDATGCRTRAGAGRRPAAAREGSDSSQESGRLCRQLPGRPTGPRSASRSS
jgi:hypothetical protein